MGPAFSFRTPLPSLWRTRGECLPDSSFRLVLVVTTRFTGPSMLQTSPTWLALSCSCIKTKGLSSSSFTSLLSLSKIDQQPDLTKSNNAQPRTPPLSIIEEETTSTRRNPQQTQQWAALTRSTSTRPRREATLLAAPPTPPALLRLLQPPPLASLRRQELAVCTLPVSCLCPCRSILRV